MVHGRIVKI